MFAPVIDSMCVYEYKYNNFGCEISRLVFADSWMINVDAPTNTRQPLENTPLDFFIVAPIFDEKETPPAFVCLSCQWPSFNPLFSFSFQGILTHVEPRVGRFELHYWPGSYLRRRWTNPLSWDGIIPPVIILGCCYRCSFIVSARATFWQTPGFHGFAVNENVEKGRQ